MTPRRCTLPPRGAAAAAAAAHRASVPELETERLRLRAPVLDDLPAWTEICAAWPTGAISAETAWEEFSYYTSGWMLHGHGLWAVELHDGPLVGFVHVGLEWDDWEPELGWMLIAEHRGKGYATEAAQAAATYARDILPTFVSYIDPMNTASQRVAERLGARRDAQREAEIQRVDGHAAHVWRHGGDPA